MGSHKRKTTRTGGKGSGGGGGGDGGGNGGSSGSNNGKEKQSSKEIEKQIKHIIFRSSKKIQVALAENNFSRAADIATSVAVVKSPIKDTLNLFLASAKAYKESKEQHWEPKPSEVAGRAIAYAQEKTGYSLPINKNLTINRILTNTLTTTAEKQRRKSS